MNRYIGVAVVIVGALLGYLLHQGLFMVLKKKHTNLKNAQKAAAEHHYLATCWNAVGLGVGIFMVFFMGSFAQWWIVVGMILVLLSIFVYITFDRVALDDDKQVVDLQQPERFIESGDFVSRPEFTMPEKLTFKDGYIAIEYPHNSTEQK